VRIGFTSRKLETLSADIKLYMSKY